MPSARGRRLRDCSQPSVIVKIDVAESATMPFDMSAKLPRMHAMLSVRVKLQLLGQLMFGTAIVALLAVSLRQLLPGISGALQVHWLVWESLVVISGAMAAP